jgi:hypothetical protein
MRTTFAAPLAVALILALLAMLAGCDAPYVRQYTDAFRDKYGWTEERTLSEGWIPSRNIPPEPAYCYRTLADADCYVEAEPPHEDPRLIGSYGQATQTHDQ